MFSYKYCAVAAYEGLIGLHLEAGQVCNDSYKCYDKYVVKIHLKILSLQDVTSSILADKCLQLFTSKPKNEGNAIEDLYIRANAIKGLVELVIGNIVSG